MRAPPPLQVTLHRFELWRASLWTLAACVLAAVGAWAWTSRDQQTPAVLGAIALAAAAVLILLLRAASVARAELLWDGSSWQLFPAEDPQHVRGELRPAIDLGFWMLLCFEPEAGARVIWLPVQRRGIEGQWHALRCAVFAPAPAPDSA